MRLIEKNTKEIEICNRDLYERTAVKGVLFDMDGVILDTEKLYTRFWKEAAPDIYVFAATKLGLRPEECLVIEDSPTGLLAGLRAGCIPIMIPDQDQPNDEMKDRIYAVADSLQGVISLFDI